jgi:hypothetical protein
MAVLKLQGDNPACQKVTEDGSTWKEAPRLGNGVGIRWVLCASGWKGRLCSVHNWQEAVRGLRVVPVAVSGGVWLCNPWADHAQKKCLCRVFANKKKKCLCRGRECVLEHCGSAIPLWKLYGNACRSRSSSYNLTQPLISKISVKTCDCAKAVGQLEGVDGDYNRVPKV